MGFIQNYADAGLHAKEEKRLFPALESAGMPRDGRPIAVMLHEHVQDHSHAGKIAESLEAAARRDDEARFLLLWYTLVFANLLTGHIQKENSHPLNMAGQMLPPDDHALPAAGDLGTTRRNQETRISRLTYYSINSLSWPFS